MTCVQTTLCVYSIGNCRNARGLGKSIHFFRLFEKLRYSNERSTKFKSLYQEWKYLEEENGKMVALRISPKIESEFEWIGYTSHKIIRIWMEFCNFCEAPIWPIFCWKLGWVAFHSVKFELKCLDFQSDQYKNLVPVLSRFCNGLL